jgi:hypothetical protein
MSFAWEDLKRQIANDEDLENAWKIYEADEASIADRLNIKEKELKSRLDFYQQQQKSKNNFSFKGRQHLIDYCKDMIGRHKESNALAEKFQEEIHQHGGFGVKKLIYWHRIVKERTVTEALFKARARVCWTGDNWMEEKFRPRTLAEGLESIPRDIQEKLDFLRREAKILPLIGSLVDEYREIPLRAQRRVLRHRTIAAMQATGLSERTFSSFKHLCRKEKFNARLVVVSSFAKHGVSLLRGFLKLCERRGL